MTVKRLLLIANPRSGKGRGMAILRQVQPVFAAADTQLDIRVTEHSGHARQIAQECDPARLDGLCVIGGDGTFHETVSGLIEQGEPALVPLGVIPGGTGNDVARHIGTGNPLEAAQRIVAGRTAPFDVARVESAGHIDYCVTLIGWAGVADVNCKAERLRMIGPSRYAVAALGQILFAKRRHAVLILDERTLEDEFMLVAACNTVFSGSGMRLAPRARTDDGKLDVVILRNASRWQMLRLFAKVFDGSHVDMPCVEYHQVRALSIIADDRGPLDLDGEIKGTTPVSIETLPGAIRVFV